MTTPPRWGLMNAFAETEESAMGRARVSLEDKPATCRATHHSVSEEAGSLRWARKA